MNAKIYVHPIFAGEPSEPVLIKHHQLPDTETLRSRIERQQVAMVCACDWLRQGAPGRALEVLEANL